MDGIQPYAPHNRPPAVAHHHAHTPSAPAPANPAAVKTPSDYVRALRRRIWLVFMIGVPLSIASAAYAVHQKAVYRAVSQILIKPPQYDPMLETMLSQQSGGGRRQTEINDKYLPNRVAQLKSKGLAERVVNDPAFLQAGAVSEGDAADELIENLQTKIVIGTNYVNVYLEGQDPARTARQLSTLLELFHKETKAEVDNQNEDIREYAKLSLKKLHGEIQDLDKRLIEMLKTNATIGPGGKNLIASEYESLGAMLSHKKMRLDEVQQQALMAQLFPKNAITSPEENSRQAQIERLHEKRQKLDSQLRHHKALIRNYASDPSVKETARRLEDVLDQLDALQRIPKQAALDPSEMIVNNMREEIHAAEEASKMVLGELRESMPKHQMFLALQEEREQKAKRVGDMETKVSEFDMLSQTQKAPVELLDPVAEPTVPIRPRRALNIAIGIILSFGLGLALVCLLEHLDHSVKVPEHLTIGLTLPLLGVVPRIRRTSLTHRGGHLWTPGAPESVEADAYRNLRASLLGAADRIGRIVTLLVTSAKAGEGKSTTALNLAATCARAGERTLLMDVDLRRPSLNEVFRDGPTEGLIDVLRGQLPWQRTVVRTDIPNLDFLTTGDTRDIPIEILGTLELRQLLIGLANHYDRVILDGPAVLGLADCRMLGRVVDAAVLVVRSGTHEMRPLQRAKAMLEQSRVVLAGVVFNGLFEDLQNWSSYGPYQPYASGEGYPLRATTPRDELEASEDADAALPLAGA